MSMPTDHRKCSWRCVGVLAFGFAGVAGAVRIIWAAFDKLMSGQGLAPIVLFGLSNSTTLAFWYCSVQWFWRSYWGPVYGYTSGGRLGPWRKNMAPARVGLN